MSRMCREKGAVKHDDRIDALAQGVKWFTDALALSATEQVKKRKMDEFLDAILQTLKFFNDQGRRIFEHDINTINKYCSVGEVDWVSANNMFYSPEQKTFAKVDHEPNILWVEKDVYMNDAIRSFIALFGGLMALRAHKHIMDYVADGKNILKRIEYCMDFVENEIFD